MKNKWFMLPVALLAVFGLIFAGCSNGSSGSGEEGGGVVKTYDLTMGDNFQYGEGYQGKNQSLSIFSAEGVKAGDAIKMEYEFTVTRDLEDTLQTGIVDESPDLGYWFGLTWDSTDDSVDPDIIAGEGAVIKAGETVSGTLNMTAIANATAAGPNYNTLMFQTEGEGNPGSAGSGVKGPVTLKFTKLIVTNETTGKSVTLAPKE